MNGIKKIMTSKNAKTVLFALLVLSLAIPATSSTANAQKQTRTTYDPMVTQYLESVIYEPSTTQHKVVDGQTITVTTQSSKMSDGKYELQSITTIDGNELLSETFVITINADGTYRFVNESQGIDETFTDEKPKRMKRGTGSSDSNGARISLYDKEYGTPNTLRLSDSYSGCGVITQGKFDANVTPKTIDVTWIAHPYYAHFCLVPHLYDHVEVQYGTDKQIFDNGQKTRKGNHAFTNTSVGTTWYSVSVNFVYGAW